MIRYPISDAHLKERVRQEKALWLDDAETRTNHFEHVKTYDEEKGSWGEIKAVYMSLQHNKCAYCERKLASADTGKIEHDVEHFRPKNRVIKWPTVSMARTRKLKYDFQLGGDWDEGYYLQAYNIFNYATACKPCNSVLKKNFFPIGGVRGQQSRDARALNAAEEPLLIYPIGDVDDNPEDLIEFDGIIPVPVVRTSTDYRARRAQVTIDFFRLQGREDLREQRAQVIEALFMGLENARHHPNPRIRQQAVDAANDMLHPASQHTNCARAFHKVYQQDYARALDLFTAARDLVRSKRR